MTTLSKTKYATENFVWAVVNDLEKKIEKRFDNAETKAERRFDKVMTALVDISGKFKKFDEEQTIHSHRIKTHSDQIEKLERAVFSAS